MRTLTKILSSNDVGETGAHQAGMLVPKGGEYLKFFPALDAAMFNPRCVLLCIDSRGKRWEFNFIYYNNRSFGGTRNEYRLTRMTKFFREAGAMSGDGLVINCREGKYFVDVVPAKKMTNSGNGFTAEQEAPQSSGRSLVLSFDKDWKIVSEEADNHGI